MRNLLDRHMRLPQVPESGGFRTTKPRSRSSLDFGRGQFDEVLIVDARAALRPAELVERKLISLLKSVYLPVSHVRTTALLSGRSLSSSQLDRRMSDAPAAGMRSMSLEVTPLAYPR